MTEFMKSDKALDQDINAATSYDQIRQLLENSVSRSGIADRDPQTGQFVRRDPLTPVQQQAAPPEEQVTRTEKINGAELTFTGTALEVERQIASAYRTAAALKPTELAASIAPRRAKTQTERERELFEKTELDLQFRRGELNPAEYLERTNAIGEYLASKGFDVEAAAGKQLEQSWREATDAFLRSTPEGQAWRGGQKNLELAGNLLQAQGLTDAPDKVAALQSIARYMAEKGLMFDGDTSPEQLIAMTNDASPQEIVQAWKERQGTPEDANEAFIQLHQGGRFFGA